MMGFVESVGKNTLNQTIGEGTFAEVKLIVNIRTCGDIIVNRSSQGDQEMVIKRNLSQNDGFKQYFMLHANFVAIGNLLLNRSEG